jgi:hypothetical protein
MKKLITLCLFGNKKIFQEGAIKNIKLAQDLYPDWTLRFYVFREDFDFSLRLEEYKNVEIVKIDKDGNFYSTLYRFLPLNEPDVEYFISRDCDSRISYREKFAVYDWINSNKSFHIMKDHPYHITPEYPILAGMFGSKGGILPDIKNYMKNICQNFQDQKGIDQKFLYHFYHEYVKNDYISHELESFPTPRDFKRDKIFFVGQAFDENDNFYANWKTDLQTLGINIDSYL